MFLLAKICKCGWSLKQVEGLFYVKTAHVTRSLCEFFAGETPVCWLGTQNSSLHFYIRMPIVSRGRSFPGKIFLFSSSSCLNYLYLRNVKKSENEVFISNALPYGEKTGRGRGASAPRLISNAKIVYFPLDLTKEKGNLVE